MDGARPGGDGEPANQRLTFLGRELARPFQRRVIVIPAGGIRAYDEAEWRDAIVVVERGVVELEGRSGRRQRFPPGSVLWLVGVPLRALRNPGSRPAVVVAVSRSYRCGRPRYPSHES